MHHVVGRSTIERTMTGSFVTVAAAAAGRSEKRSRKTKVYEVRVTSAAVTQKVVLLPAVRKDVTTTVKVETVQSMKEERAGTSAGGERPVGTMIVTRTTAALKTGLLATWTAAAVRLATRKVEEETNE